MIVPIHGICPSCGERKLFAGSGTGTLQCLNGECKRPEAANEILNDPIRDHLLVLNDRSWTVMHPLIERLDNKMLDCQMGDRVTHLMETVILVDHGVYRVAEDETGELTFMGLP
jgi:hypothetical protein